MKKLYVTLIVLLMISLTMVLTACSHKHTYSFWMVKREATCSERGQEVRACECGKKQSRPIALIDHTPGEWITVTASTCTGDGLKHRTCSVCGLTLQVAAIDATGHAAGEWVTVLEPTTAREGSRSQFCLLCGAALKTEPIPAKPAFLVILDAGHGGKDQGAAVGEVLEKNINLQVAYRLKAQLEARGVDAILTRENDEKLELSRRAELANTHDAQLFVSVHCNFYDESTSVSGFEIYYYQDDRAKIFADAILSDLAATGQVKTRKVISQNFYVLKNTTMPAILLEMGFLTNDQERQKLCSDEYQDMLAGTIASGIVRTLRQMG